MAGHAQRDVAGSEGDARRSDGRYARERPWESEDFNQRRTLSTRSCWFIRNRICAPTGLLLVERVAGKGLVNPSAVLMTAFAGR